MKKNILVIGQLPPPYHGSNVMTGIFISSLRKIGYEVSIAEKKFSLTMGEVEKINIKKVARAPLIFINIIKKIILESNELCVYFLSVKPPSIYIDTILLLLLKLINKQTILYIHGKGFKKYAQKHPAMKWILRSEIFKFPKGAFVLGEKLKKDISWFLKNKRLFKLQNCIVQEKKSENTKKDAKTPDGIQILYLSNLVPEKGPIEFVKMAHLVNKMVKTVKFVIAGAVLSPEFKMKIESLISAYKLNDKIKMVGAVYGDKKDFLFKESDIFVFPTYYELEAFPLVNLEAMSAGLPVISSNEGSISEAVIHGKNGYIVDPHNPSQIADYVLNLIKDEELRKNMGIASRQIFEKRYSLKAYHKKLEEGINHFIA